MRDILKSVPNLLTLLRIVLLPVLWILVSRLFSRIGMAAARCVLTDSVDGPIARA